MNLGENAELVRLLVAIAILSGSISCLIAGFFWECDHKKQKS